MRPAVPAHLHSSGVISVIIFLRLDSEKYAVLSSALLHTSTNDATPYTRKNVGIAEVIYYTMLYFDFYYS